MNANPHAATPVITGLGVMTSIGQGKAEFAEALFAGKTAFGYLQRAGRESGNVSPFIGAEISEPNTTRLSPEHARLLRTASLSAKLSLVVALEAWQDAQLDSASVDPLRIGLVVGGSNIQQRIQWQTWQRHAENPAFLTPSYGLTVWDSDLVGVLSQALDIQGEGFVIGNGTASGAAAIIHAARQVQMGITDVSLAVGTLCDLSHWECQGLKSMGAMGSDHFADCPQLAYRPFDREADGFIFGEGCGVVVIENAEHARRRAIQPYAGLRGWASTLSANRGAQTSKEGQIRAISLALQMAGLPAAAIDYVNPHGSGSPQGDQIELEALRATGLAHCWLNATKSLTGHCFTAAGTVEAIATLLQMKAGRLHPTHNLINPIDGELRWVQQEAIDASLRYAISNSFALGGVSTTLVFSNEHTELVTA